MITRSPSCRSSETDFVFRPQWMSSSTVQSTRWWRLPSRESLDRRPTAAGALGGRGPGQIQQDCVRDAASSGVGWRGPSADHRGDPLTGERPGGHTRTGAVAVVPVGIMRFDAERNPDVQAALQQLCVGGQLSASTVAAPPSSGPPSTPIVYVVTDLPTPHAPTGHRWRPASHRTWIRGLCNSCAASSACTPVQGIPTHLTHP